MPSAIEARLAHLGSLVRRTRTAVHRASDRWAERFWEVRRLSRYAAVDDGEMSALLRRMGAPGLNEYAAQQSASARRLSFVPRDREAVVARLDREFPWFRRSCIEAADRVCRGEFDLLGSGPVNVTRGGRGIAIDWRLDPRTGARYPGRFSHWRAARPAALAGVGGDIKGPWEVGRCQHFALLGQAYWLTGDERYARVFARTIADFIEQNPPRCGVQWSCTMDVSLRVVSWLIGLSFFQVARSLDAGWWKTLLKSVVEHGRFIAANLEFGTLDGAIVTSNHYLANLLGLQWIAHAFPELDSNYVWRGLAEYGFEREIQDQLHADGGSFESSLPYHRLVTEILLSAYAISLHAGRPLSAAYRDRLMAALRLVRVVRQPGGRMPQVGDADNGRAHILTGYGRWSPERIDHLLAAGARVLNCAELAADLDDVDAVESIFWDTPAVAPTSFAAIAPVERFDDSGLAVLRSGPTMVLTTNSRAGTKGFGNHKHCDQLAIEVCVGAQPVFVDAGSYVYTSDPDERNRFRGTAIHNTVMVDGVEQHGLNPLWLFRLSHNGDAAFDPRRDAGAQIDGRHTAYVRLTPPFTHHRRVRICDDGTLLVTDSFDGQSGHRLRWHFLLHPAVTARRTGDGISLTWHNGRATFTSTPALPFEVSEGWYSPSYGEKQPTAALVAETDAAPETVTLALRAEIAGEHSGG